MEYRSRVRITVVGVLCAALVALCGLGSLSCGESEPELNGGILATFDVQGETYSVFITNEDTIEDVFALQEGESSANIPSGRLLAGSVWYNEPWSWHIDSEDIHMAEITIEVCDGLPSHVEDSLDYWLNTVGRFCPWSAELIEVQDYR